MENALIHTSYFRSNGKLMLTGEYLVLKGAKSLALPLGLGQDLKIQVVEGDSILWTSKVKGEDWFDVELNSNSLEIISTTKKEIANTLKRTLQIAKELNTDFLHAKNGYIIQSEIDFNLNWGLGSSSSFISNVAFWAKCDPYELNRKVFKGSGYDIACARSNKPVLYQLENNLPFVKEIGFEPNFSDKLLFVWLNQKQNTRDEIGRFDIGADYSAEIIELNLITDQMIHTNNFYEFEKLIQQHEQIISKIIKTKPVKEVLFNDFKGSVKSLGAWGGDFVLVASKLSFDEIKNYFNQKGFNTVFKYNDLVLFE